MRGGIATAGQTLTAGHTTNNGNLTVSGNITGGGALVKNGSGTFTFASTTTAITGALGAVSLNTGTIAVGDGAHSATLNTGAIAANVSTTLTIATGGTVVANYASGSTTFSGALAGSGTFEKDGAGTLVFDHSFSASGLTLTLGGGTLELTGGAGFTFGTIHITGNTVLDFNNSAGTFLSSASLIIDPGVTITVNNWTSLSTAWYVRSGGGAGTVNGGALGGTSQFGGTPLDQIGFNNYNGMTTTWVAPGNGQGWLNYEIRPTPEPATYGALLLSAALSLLGFRSLRRKRQPPGRLRPGATSRGGAGRRARGRTPPALPAM
jgi:hypothetical protein